MKKFFRKLGFRKMDEMEQYIAYKAQRNALVFLIFALFVWTICEACKVIAYDTMLNPLPCLLLTASSSIQLISQLVMARNAVKNEEEPKTSPAAKIIVSIGIVIGIVITVGAVIMVMGIGV